jgi:hypothetical protein
MKSNGRGLFQQIIEFRFIFAIFNKSVIEWSIFRVDSTVIDSETRGSATDPPVGGIAISPPFIFCPRGDSGIKKYDPNTKTE